MGHPTLCPTCYCQKHGQRRSYAGLCPTCEYQRQVARDGGHLVRYLLGSLAVMMALIAVIVVAPVIMVAEACEFIQKRRKIREETTCPVEEQT